MKFPFDELNMCDAEHVGWVKSQRDPEALAEPIENPFGPKVLSLRSEAETASYSAQNGPVSEKWRARQDSNLRPSA